MSSTKLFVCPDDGYVCGQCKIADCECECHAFDTLACDEIIGVVCACHTSARPSTFNGMSRNKIMEWIQARRNPMKFAEMAALIDEWRSSSMIDSSPQYQKDNCASKTAATSPGCVMAKESQMVSGVSKKKPANKSNARKKMVKPAYRKSSIKKISAHKKKCAQASV